MRLKGQKSHLLQMRGLKPVQNQQKKNWKRSHLLQMRGLKHPYQKKYQYNSQVASFTDAWIETARQTAEQFVNLCRIFYRCVD